MFAEPFAVKRELLHEPERVRVELPIGDVFRGTRSDRHRDPWRLRNPGSRQGRTLPCGERTDLYYRGRPVRSGRRERIGNGGVSDGRSGPRLYGRERSIVTYRRRLTASLIVGTAALVASDALAQSPTGPRVLVMPFAVQAEPAAPGGAVASVWVGEAAAILLSDKLRELGLDALSRDERVAALDRLELPLSSTLWRISSESLSGQASTRPSDRNLKQVMQP